MEPPKRGRPVSLSECSLPVEGVKQLLKRIEESVSLEALCLNAAAFLMDAFGFSRVDFAVKDDTAAPWRYADSLTPLPIELENPLDEGLSGIPFEGGTLHAIPLRLHPPLQAAVLITAAPELDSEKLDPILREISVPLSNALLSRAYEHQGRLVLQFTRKLRALQQVNLVINNSYELNELSAEICSITTQALGAQYAGLYHLEEGGLRMIEDLAVFKSKGLSLLKMLKDANKAAPKEVIPLERSGFLGEAVKTGKQLAINDLLSRPQDCPQELQEHQLASVIATPLATQREMLGVLLVGTSEARKFTASEVELLADIARQATGAFITSKLYRETVEEKQRADRMVEQLKTLNEATAEVGKTLDTTATCQELFNHLSLFTDVRWAGIFLLKGTNFCYTLGSSEIFDAPPDSWLQALRQANYPKSLTLNPEKGTFFEGPQVTLLPLLASNQLLGLVILSNEKTNETEMDLVKALVSHAALALNNSLMHTQVEQQAITDPLTELFNRRYFNDRLRMELHRSDRYKHPVSLMIMDIDFFKKCNDVLGHLGGDTVLKELSALLRDKMRQVDIVARYGGEEFAVILPETPIESAYLVCEKIRVFIEEYPFTDQERLPHKNITASLGVATYPNHADSLEELIKVADVALYWAKESGRNRTCAAEEPLLPQEQ